MNRTITGYLLGALSAATYGLIPLFTLPLYERGMSPNSALLLRYIFAIPIVGAMALIRGQRLKVTRSDLLPLFMMGIMVALSSLFLFESYNFINAGISSTILFIYPAVVAVLMAVLYHERLSIVTISCIVLALLGIVLLYKGPDGATLNLAGTLLAVFSGTTYAVYIVGANRKRFKTMPTLVMLFYVLISGVILFASRSWFVGDFSIPHDFIGWGCAIGLAAFPTAVSFGCTTVAVQYIGSTRTAILGALEPVTALLVSWLVFGEWLSPREWVGITIIIFAITLVTAGDAAAGYLLRIRRMFPRRRRN